MWQKTYTIYVENMSPNIIWNIWSDMSRRSDWDTDTEWAKLNGAFVEGAVFTFKPKDGPKLSMKITQCTINKSFTDCFKIPFARMYGIHRMTEGNQGINIITTIKVEGLFAWLLKKIVAEKVAADIPAQTEALIKIARADKERFCR